MSEHNLYDSHLERRLSAGAEHAEAVEALIRAYVDGKPTLSQKKKLSRVARDTAFWSSAMVKDLTTAQWNSELVVLALTRYLSQEKISSPDSIYLVAALSPNSLSRAVRYSGLVLRPHSTRRKEINQVASLHPQLFELCTVLDIFSKAHRERLNALAEAKSLLESLTAFELLIYASLYGFEHLASSGLGTNDSKPISDESVQSVWDGINDLLVWKIQTCKPESLALTEKKIGASIRAHLSPVLFPGEWDTHSHQTLRQAFASALAIQIELNEFISRSADAFSYDDGIRFALKNEELTIETIDASRQAVWDLDNVKLNRLHNYWLNRAIEDYVGSDISKRQIGSAENAEYNRLAYLRAARTYLRLHEVYGISEAVVTDTEVQVDVFRALLSLELMSAFFLRDVIEEFMQHLKLTGNPYTALTALAMEGLSNGENRFPLTWSERETKVANIVGWTVNPEHPQGSTRMANAILDFWTYDLSQLAEKLNHNERTLSPQLFERPVLRFGRHYVQLPWIVGVQNNSTAAINNLRRLGARRNETKEETHQIELRLGQLFKSRGFRVMFNWEPSDKSVGEIDLICARDGHILVIEVKSTFMRRSQREAWLHATTTLRKAGQQLHRKVDAVREAIRGTSELAQQLGLETEQAEQEIEGWIVDTSIERDHERFNGFLKVSLEEILIALRDEAYLLYEDFDEDMSAADLTPDSRSLYPTGFSAVAFVDVITANKVWGMLN